jgi:fermentation-respiration switch protein FrsA (DUF1100 family)
MKLLFTALIALLYGTAFSADSTYTEIPVSLNTGTGELQGTLMLPLHAKKKVPVALLIAGSGPTDRNGNTPLIRGANNSLLYLAQGLAAKGIATLRYDKRGIGKSMGAMKKEADLRFDDYVSDAQGWLAQLRKDRRFNRIYIIGHSEGSLIGMLAAGGADGYISIAGAGFPMDSVLRRQLSAQPEALKIAAFPILDSLRAGYSVQRVPPFLYSLFRPSVQPYMISWLKYDPRAVISQLSVPVLIVQGEADIQALPEDARALKAAAPRAELALIPGMNHVLKACGSMDNTEQMKTYSDPSLPLVPELLKRIAGFINRK